jgi:hypothetical protein
VEVVEEAWKLATEEPSQSTYNALKTVAASLLNWSHNVLGDLEKRVKKIKKELEECRRMGIDREQVVRESLLRYKLERVEEQIDIYWKQRAHINWLQKGDRNTTFFHAACRERLKKNQIARLRREDNVWLEGEEEKRAYIANYFAMLFRSNGGHTSQLLLNAVDSRISPAMNENLVKEFTREEVRVALDSIGDLKAPGPDGMPSVFYKNFWETVGDRVV